VAEQVVLVVGARAFAVDLNPFAGLGVHGFAGFFEPTEETGKRDGQRIGECL